MLFHEPAFLLAFLPISVIGFFLLSRRGYRRSAQLELIGASLFFYGWWNPIYLPLLLGSIVINFVLGWHLQRRVRTPGLHSQTGHSIILIGGIAANLMLLAYFKYANFFVDSLNDLAGTSFTLVRIILPLGISFFTFEQIAWLVETHQGRLPDIRFLEYCAFITNFPKLIAGPVIRPHELLPQLRDPAFGRFRIEHLSVGVTIFAIGLFKKVVLADSMSPLVGPVFHASALGTPVTLLEAWGATLAYTLQIYFDFSGYTDMAIGAARMFGLVLPLNFASPYKSRSIIDFWRRWHMSLSRFIRDYVYIPLGGSRGGAFMRYRNLLITMTFVGLWHGAGWTFVLWGALHGVLLVINHLWRALCPRTPIKRWWSAALAWCATFAAVMAGWVFFRAENVASALRMLGALAGMSGVSLPAMLRTWLGTPGAWLMDHGVTFDLERTLILTPGEWAAAAPWIAGLLLIALILPNTQEFMRTERPALDAPDEAPHSGLREVVWKPTMSHAFLLSGLTIVSLIFLMLSRQSEFLYFQF